MTQRTTPEDEALCRAELCQRRRKAVFRAGHRGLKEIDLVLATFAAAEAMTLPLPELAQFEALLDAPDQDIYAWLTGAAPLPEAFDTPVFARLKALCNRKEPTWTV